MGIGLPLDTYTAQPFEKKIMQAGKALENLVAVIQEHLKNCSDAKITQNARLQNRFGKKRQIDVFVQAKLNGENIGIAFECKDQKRPITAPAIEAFVTNISNIPEITKGVFVTTSGYTEGACEIAKAYKIGLYMIDDLPLEEIIPRHSLQSVRFFFDPKLNALQIHTIDDVTNVKLARNAMFKYEDTDEDVNLLLEIYGALNETKLLCELTAKYMEVGKKTLLLVAKITPSRQIYINDINGTKFKIDYLRIPIMIDCELEECKMSSHKKYTPLTDNLMVSVAEYGSSMNDNAWVVVDSGEGKTSCFIKNNDCYYKPDIVIEGKCK